jgi:SnoaL-like domain
MFKRLTILVLTASFVVAFAAEASAAPAQIAVMATVHQFIDAFNKGDAKSALALCDSRVSIIDDFPPHEWQGSTACSDWVNAYGADAKKNGITDGNVTLGMPWHVYATGGRGYVVVPVTYTYKQKGKPVTESGSVFTVALKKVAAGWRITGWAWAQH